jgi:Flp pilus assembly pilin Flp
MHATTRRRTRALLTDTRGLSTVEYIMILCLVAVVGFAMWQKFGTTVKTKVRGSDGILSGVGPGSP